MTGLLSLTTVVTLTMPVFGADSVTVSCNLGDEYLGDLGDSADVTQAVRLGNATYVTCARKCISCFHDFKADEDICVDNQERKVSQ